MDFTNDGGHAVLLMKAGGLPSFTDSEFTFRSQQQIQGEQVPCLSTPLDKKYAVLGCALCYECMHGCAAELMATIGLIQTSEIRTDKAQLERHFQMTHELAGLCFAAVPGQAAEPAAGNLLDRRLQHGLLRPPAIPLQAVGMLLFIDC